MDFKIHDNSEPTKAARGVLRGLPVPSFFLCMFLLFLSGCASVPEGRQEGPLAVAVWDLENLSYEPLSHPDMSQMLAGAIIEVVRTRGGYSVVERQKLESVLEELNLGSSALADEGAKLRVGRLSGAREMIFGGYQVAGEAMRIDLRRVDVETGKVLKASQETATAGDMAAWLNAAKKAALELF